MGESSCVSLALGTAGVMTEKLYTMYPENFRERIGKLHASQMDVISEHLRRKIGLQTDVVRLQSSP